MFKKGHKHSKETKEKIRLSNLGHTVSLEVRKKLSDFRLGSKLSEETKQKLRGRTGEKSPSWGRVPSAETRKKWSDFRKGKGHPHTEESRRKISESKKGDKSHLWRGGITPIHQKIRGSLEYRLWRESVFKRDNWTCVWCNIRSAPKCPVILNADHIKPFSLFPELRFAIDNGRTLCIDCHKKTDTYGIKLHLNEK